MKRLTIGFGLAAVVICAGRATATPINVTALRTVLVGALVAPPIFVEGPSSPSTALGAFSDSVLANLGDEDVSADQSSDIQPGVGLFTGTGTSTVGFSVLEVEEIFANSFFDVFFDITTPHSYSLAGELAANIDGGQGEAWFLIFGPTPFSFVAFDFGTSPLASSGVLAPGSYHLQAFALLSPGPTIEPDSFMGGSAAFDFTFEIEELVTTVPEPATLALLALGLAGLGFAGRGKRSE